MISPAPRFPFPPELTLNERRILISLTRQGKLTKKDLVRRCQAGWATVVKMVDRLIHRGLIEKGGTAPPVSGRGKNAYVYRLSPQSPCSLGIDVEYNRTEVILGELGGLVLFRAAYPTPPEATTAGLVDFLIQCCRQVLEETPLWRHRIIGAGIGFPLWITPLRSLGFADVGEKVSKAIGLPVRIQNNVRNFALYHKWLGDAYALKDFAVVTIRDGIGCALYIKDSLLTGTRGLAGEIGHIPVQEGGRLCHCGKRGCLETLVNQQTLYQHYLDLQSSANPPPQKELSLGLASLFRSIRNGDPAAQKLLQGTTGHLARGLAALLLLMDIEKIFLAGSFGSSGASLLPLLQASLSEELLPDSQPDLAYLPLNNNGFTLGAALLFFQDYFAPLPEE